MLSGKVNPIPGSLPGRSVCDHNLPISVGRFEEVIKPLSLSSPQVFEVLIASCHRPWPEKGAMVHRLVVGSFAHLLLFKKAGIDKVVLHDKAYVAYDRPVVLGRQHPTASAPRAAPGVAYGLVPAGCKARATVVLVPQHAQPLLVIQTLTLVDVLKDMLPLACVRSDERMRTTMTSYATPDAATGVQNIVRLLLCCAFLHLLRNEKLRMVVNSSHRLTPSGTHFCDICGLDGAILLYPTPV
mmetsp:Transcript_95041/g.183232  ORF Transcript_95041/g.183232 Transcript_95041/m.183232 type:complete len:241 (-) Transcript_95041:595-1317(-)